MNTYDVIKSLCEQKGIAMTALEKELGFGRGSLGKMKNGGKPSGERLQQIANYFGVSVNYLMTGEDNDSEYVARNETERRLLVLFRNTESVPDDERKEIVEHFEQTIDLYLKAKGINK